MVGHKQRIEPDTAATIPAIPAISARTPTLPLRAADLYAAIDWDPSPQCWGCRHYAAGEGDGHYCAAYPAWRRKPIPGEFYSGRVAHATPRGDEQRDQETGTPIIFEPTPEQPESLPDDADADAETDE